MKTKTLEQLINELDYMYVEKWRTETDEYAIYQKGYYKNFSKDKAKLETIAAMHNENLRNKIRAMKVI